MLKIYDADRLRRMSADQKLHWDRNHVNWQNIKPPLRPHPEDIEILKDAIDEHFADGPCRERYFAALFGVTPEIATMEWSRSTYLVAFDNSVEMIEKVWPGNTDNRTVFYKNWLSIEMSNARGNYDFGLGDGCFNAISYPDEYEKLAATMASMITKGGLLALRMFCQPNKVETVADIVSDFISLAEKGQPKSIGNFHILKWRLLMALQGENTRRGVKLSAAWDAFVENFWAPQAISDYTGWPIEEVRTIESYCNSTGFYSFPTEVEVPSLLIRDFELIKIARGTYEMADRCPHLFFRRR